MSGMKFEKEIFMKYLIEREASEATKKKYMTDVTTFYSYAAEAEEIDNFHFVCMINLNSILATFPTG